MRRIGQIVIAEPGAADSRPHSPFGNCTRTGLAVWIEQKGNRYPDPSTPHTLEKSSCSRVDACRQTLDRHFAAESVMKARKHFPRRRKQSTPVDRQNCLSDVTGCGRAEK